MMISLTRENLESARLKARGVFRDPDSDRTLFIAFNRRPTDDEMRAIHEILRHPGDPS
jgi:hypothetical protein